MLLLGTEAEQASIIKGMKDEASAQPDPVSK